MLSIQQTALQHLENGNWADAHDLIQHEKDTLSCLIHAHLHRLEGDASNAAHWYQRAGKNLADLSLEQEFDQLCQLAESET